MGAAVSGGGGIELSFGSTLDANRDDDDFVFATVDAIEEEDGPPVRVFLVGGRESIISGIKFSFFLRLDLNKGWSDFGISSIFFFLVDRVMTDTTRSSIIFFSTFASLRDEVEDFSSS